jgi:F0F1-type ATP synthase assembly protein I
MSSNALAAGARQAWQILLWQAGSITAVAAFCAVALDLRAGWSVLAGGGIGLIWTVYMALTMFRHSVDHGVRLSAVGLFVGWLIKLVLTFSLLIIALRSEAMAPLPLLGGLSVALIAYWARLTFRVKHADGKNGK